MSEGEGTLVSQLGSQPRSCRGGTWWHFGLENTAGGHLVQRSAFRQGNSGSWKFVTNRVKADKEMDDFLLEPSLLSIQVIVIHWLSIHWLSIHC